MQSLTKQAVLVGVLVSILGAGSAFGQTPFLPGNYIAWAYTATGPDVLDHFEVRIDDGVWTDVGMVVDAASGLFVAAPPTTAGVFFVEVRPCRAAGANDPPREADGSDINCATSVSPPARFLITRTPTTLPPVDGTDITQTPYTPPIVDNSLPRGPFAGYCVRGSYTPDWTVGLVVNAACEPLVMFSQRNYDQLDTCRTQEVCPIPCGVNDCWNWNLWPEGPTALNTVRVDG